MSKEVGPYGVRVNTVSPGPVATDLWLGDNGVAATIARDTGQNASAVAESAASDSVTGRFTLPSEVAGLVVYLASDRAANITGGELHHRRRPDHDPLTSTLVTRSRTGSGSGPASPSSVCAERDRPRQR